MSSPLFYRTPIALNSETHRKLKIKPSDEGLKFSGKTNSVLLAGVEFAEACKHFPIVFAKVAEQRVLPLALLGFRNEENLFVDANGQWKCDYVPAYVRRYPFVLAAADASGQLVVCIDEAYPGFGADEGQPLFNDKGESTDYLKGVLGFLQDYQAQLGRTDTFLEALRDCDLLVDAAANVELPGGEKFSIGGLMMVDERKLLALPEAQILRLFRSGDLAWIHCHLVSISNFKRLRGNSPSSDAPRPASAAPEATKPAATAQKPAKK